MGAEETAAVLRDLVGRAIADPDDAMALAGAVGEICGRRPLDVPALEAALGLMQSIESFEAFEVLSGVMGRLAAVFDEEAEGMGGLEAAQKAEREALLLFVAKVMALYRSPLAVPRLARAATTEGWDGHPLWPVVIAGFDEDHPLRKPLVEAMRAPLPRSLAGAALAALATEMAKSGELVFHPFDSEEGLSLLKGWLSEPGDLPRAAAAVLQHVGGSRRDELVAMGLGHPSASVRLEAAHAAARLGRPEGTRELADLCLSAPWSLAAREKLEALGQADAVPPEAKEPNFEAAAHLASWLSEPQQFGRPPASMELIDTRELLWAPAGDLRRMWIFRYGYEEPERMDAVGVVGSITYSLPRETNPGMAPEDVYALHCCWEMQVDEHPRAPSVRNVAEGRRLLGFPAGGGR